MKILRILNKIYDVYIVFIFAHPATLILALPIHFLAWGALSVIAGVLLLPILWIAHEDAWIIIETIHGWISIGLLVVVFLHYVQSNIMVFVETITIKGNRTLLFRILQLLISSVFSFAVIFYYLQLYSENKAFSGISAIDFGYSPHHLSILDKFLIVPSLDTIVDCLYFSIVTITTLGYGDIKPITTVAKLLVIIEVFAGFIVVVLSLGSVVGSVSRNGDKSNHANTADAKKPRG